MRLTVSILFLFFSVNMFAQKKLYTKNGTITFFSKTKVENIEAINKKALCVWETNTGKIEFSALMKGFEFEKALMQEHFNENYVESDKYPKALFKGIVENNDATNFNKNGTYTAKISGTITMHGVTKNVNTTALIKVNNMVVSASCSFTILLADYNIKVPSLVAASISKSILININVAAFSNL